MKKMKWLAIAAAAASFMVTGCMQTEAGKSEPKIPASESKPATDSPAPQNETPAPEQIPAPEQTAAPAPEASETEEPAPSSGGGGGSGGGAPAAEPPTAIAAAKLSDLAFKYGFLALNSPKDFSAAVKAANGCALQAEFAAAIKDARGAALGESISAYCSYLAAKGSIVDDQDEAISNAEQLDFDLGTLAKLCENGLGDVVLAKSLVLISLSYRSSLGLPLPKRASSR